MSVGVAQPGLLDDPRRLDVGADADATRAAEPVSLRDVLAWPSAKPPTIALPRSPVLRRAAAGLLAAWMIAAGIILILRPMPDDPGPAEAAPATAVDPETARVATARLPLVDVYQSPTTPGVLLTLEHPTPSGTPLRFLVEAEWENWYRVRVPAPPAGTTGWVRMDAVDVTELRVRVTIDLDAHLLTAYEEGKIVLRAPAAIGTRDRPKVGRTFVTDRIAFPASRSGYGSRALPLAGYPDGKDRFSRGRGLVGIHAVDDALDVGQSVVEGSVGLAADDMKKLFDLVPPGTPVEVVARVGQAQA